MSRLAVIRLPDHIALLPDTAVVPEGGVVLGIYSSTGDAFRAAKVAAGNWSGCTLEVSR